jgi:hypothetical protein
MKAGSYIRAAQAASFADEPRLKIGQPYIIRPSIAAAGMIPRHRESRP